MLKLDDILGQVKQVEETKLKEENTSSVDPRILILKKNAKYLGRLVPYFDKKDPSDARNTIVTYEEVGFPSKADGSYVFCGRSPKNAGVAPKSDVLNQTQWDSYKKCKEAGDKPGMDYACKLIPKRKQIVNFYLQGVEGDDAAKEKIGKVLVLRYPAQLGKDKQPSSAIYKVVSDALYGDKAAKIGTRALDLSAKGRSLEIKVGVKDKFPDYSASFDDAEDLGLTPAQIKELHATAHDLSEFIPAVKSETELKQILDEHWFVKNAAKEDELDDNDGDITGSDDDVSSEIDKALKDVSDDDNMNFD